MRVIWTPEALQDRIDIWDYLATDNPPAAARMDSVFSAAATRLMDHPRIGRQGMVTGTLELIPHEHYRLVYEIESDTAWILALVEHVPTVAAGASVSARDLSTSPKATCRRLSARYSAPGCREGQGRGGEDFVFAKAPGDNRPGAPEIRLLEAGTELAACLTGTF